MQARLEAAAQGNSEDDAQAVQGRAADVEARMPG